MFRGLALAALLVTSVLASQQTTCQRATNNTEFNPHEPPDADSADGSWFEGWYLRVSADDGSGASFGVGIGHFPGACAMLRKKPRVSSSRGKWGPGARLCVCTVACLNGGGAPMHVRSAHTQPSPSEVLTRRPPCGRTVPTLAALSPQARPAT